MDYVEIQDFRLSVDLAVKGNFRPGYPATMTCPGEVDWYWLESIDVYYKDMYLDTLHVDELDDNDRYEIESRAVANWELPTFIQSSLPPAGHGD